jgi:Serine aminopeptidase, S33
MGRAVDESPRLRATLRRGSRLEAAANNSAILTLADRRQRPRRAPVRRLPLSHGSSGLVASAHSYERRSRRGRATAERPASITCLSGMDVDVHYARSGDLNIAYATFGDGPVDFVFVPGFVSHLENWWETSAPARFFGRIASFSRLVMFDKRGTGMSDPFGGVPTLEERMDDVRAVMDAVDSTSAFICGLSEGGPMSVLFSASYPDRTRGLILIGSTARVLEAADYPIGCRRRTALLRSCRGGRGRSSSARGCRMRPRRHRRG